MSLEINIKLLTENAVIPEKAHDIDAGFDMYATSIKEKDNKYIQYGTGVAMSIPKGYVGLLFPRSSVTKKDLTLKNSIGVIDSGYLGEIMFRFEKDIVQEQISLHKINVNDDKEPTYERRHLAFNPNPEIYKINNNLLGDKIVGDKIGQIIFLKLPDVKFKITNDLGSSERGEGRFGHTDKK